MIKYADPNEIEELERLIKGIYRTQDEDVIEFMKLYFSLYNLRVELIGTQSVLLRDDIWPRINYSKTALKKYIYENDTETYKTAKDFIINDFHKELGKHAKELKKTFNELIDNKLISKSLRNKILLEFRDKHINTIRTDMKNIFYNDLVFTVLSNTLYEYYINYLKALIEEKREERRNFLLGIWLGVVGILVSVSLTLFTMK